MDSVLVEDADECGTLPLLGHPFEFPELVFLCFDSLGEGLPRLLRFCFVRCRFRRLRRCVGDISGFVSTLEDCIRFVCSMVGFLLLLFRFNYTILLGKSPPVLKNHFGGSDVLPSDCDESANQIMFLVARSVGVRSAGRMVSLWSPRSHASEGAPSSSVSGSSGCAPSLISSLPHHGSPFPLFFASWRGVLLALLKCGIVFHSTTPLSCVSKRDFIVRDFGSEGGVSTRLFTFCFETLFELRRLAVLVLLAPLRDLLRREFLRLESVVA